MRHNPGLAITRRSLFLLGAASTGIGLLSACSTSAPPATPVAPSPTKATVATAAAPAATAAAPAQATAAPTQAPAATATKPAGPKTGGTYTLALTSGVVAFNPLWPTPGTTPLLRAMYNTLAHYDRNVNLQPELAEKWDFSADGKTMTLKLRQGVKFHSGREFTSEDVKYTVKFGSTDERVSMRSQLLAIKQVETPDKYTAVFKFDSVNPGAFDILDGLFVIDNETIDSRANAAIGTGPFKLDKYTPNDRVEMVAFKDYWDKGKPYLDKYVVRQIPDLAAMVVNVESGAVDCIWQPNALDTVRLKGTGKYQVDMGAPGSTMWNLAVNVKEKGLGNKKVRQAIAWSIDRTRFCKTILQGLVEPTCLMWPTYSWAYQKDLEGKIGYDLDKAKALLKEAGVEAGFETEILTSTKRQYGFGELAQIIQADLKKIGVNAKIADIDATQFTTRMHAGEMSLMCHTYTRTNRDPGSLVTAAKAWWNNKEGGWTHFESAEYDRLRNELQSTLDQAKRSALCRQIQELILDECPVIPIAPDIRTFVNASYVRGFGYDMDCCPLVGDVWFEK